MSFFKSFNNTNICGKLDLPSGSSGNLKLMLVSDTGKHSLKLLHERSVILENGQSFTTVTEKISPNFIPKFFVLYNTSNISAWILENSVTINIYNLEDNRLLATKVIGKLDEVISLDTSSYADSPCIVFSRCDKSFLDLKDCFLKIEVISHCDRSAEAPCCDSLPQSVSVSGYSSLCIPLRDFYEVQNFTTTTTTQPPIEDEINIVYQPFLFTSPDVDHFYVKAYIKTKYNNEFSFWWERSKDGIEWERITDLDYSPSDSEISLLQIKERDYYYRAKIFTPSQKTTNFVFYKFVDRHAPQTTTTTTTTTTTLEPLTSPSSPLNVYASGGFRETYLSWDTPIDDGNLDITSYRFSVRESSNDNIVYTTGVFAPANSTFLAIEDDYDGLLLDYYIQSVNLFGYSEPAIIRNISTFALDPPLVSDLFITAEKSPYRFELDWTTGRVNSAFPLLSHRIRYKPSGSLSEYTESSYNDLETELSLTGSFDNCEIYEFLVTATNSIGESVPATGYARMAFPPSAPVNLDLSMTSAGTDGNGDPLVDIDLSWDAPVDSGLCPIDSYVYQYRLTGDDWSAIVEVEGVTSVQTNSVPSGDYVFRVAATNVVGTGDYAAWGDWLQVGDEITLTRAGLFASARTPTSTNEDASLLSISSYSFTNPSASYLDIYDFDGCSWSENTYFTSSANQQSYSPIVKNESSISAFNHLNSSLKVYSKSGNTWSLDPSPNSLSSNFIISYSDDLTYLCSNPSNSPELLYLDGSSYSSISLSSYIPVNTFDKFYSIARLTISRDGSCIAIYYTEREDVLGPDVYRSYIRVFTISGSSLSQKGNDVELTQDHGAGDDFSSYPPTMFFALSEDGSKLSIAYQEYFNSESLLAETYTYSSSISDWSSIMYEEFDLTYLNSYFNKQIYIGSSFDYCNFSTDANSFVCAINMADSDQDFYYALQVFDFSGNSLKTKGNPLLATDVPNTSMTIPSLSRNGDVLSWCIPSGGSVTAYVYKYAASSVNFPVCSNP